MKQFNLCSICRWLKSQREDLDKAHSFYMVEQVWLDHMEKYHPEEVRPLHLLRP